MTTPSDTAHLADLLIEQFGDHAAAEIVRRIRDCRHHGDEARAEEWLAILDAVFARQAKTAAGAEADDDISAAAEDPAP